MPGVKRAFKHSLLDSHLAVNGGGRSKVVNLSTFLTSTVPTGCRDGEGAGWSKRESLASQIVASSKLCGMNWQDELGAFATNSPFALRVRKAIRIRSECPSVSRIVESLSRYLRPSLGHSLDPLGDSGKLACACAIPRAMHAFLYSSTIRVSSMRPGVSCRIQSGIRFFTQGVIASWLNANR